MAKYELDLLPDLDGEVVTVTLDTSLTLFKLQKLQGQGLISKNFLSNLMMAETDPSKANLEEMLNAPYIAYLNANPNGMDKDEFNSRINLDLELCGELYGELLANSAKQNQMAGSFRRATIKKK